MILIIRRIWRFLAHIMKKSDEITADRYALLFFLQIISIAISRIPARLTTAQDPRILRFTDATAAIATKNFKRGNGLSNACAVRLQRSLPCWTAAQWEAPATMMCSIAKRRCGGTRVKIWKLRLWWNIQIVRYARWDRWASSSYPHCHFLR